VTPALVALTDLVLATLLALGMEKPGWSWAWPFIVAMAIVMVVLGGLSWTFRREECGWFVGLLPGVVHACAHGVWAWAGLSVALALANGSGDHDPSKVEALLAVHNALGLLAACAVLAVGALAVFSLYFLLCDVLIHWHENEFFAGMRLEDYKSHLRISIRPPSVQDTAGDLKVDVLGIQRVPKQKRGHLPKAPVVELVESFEVKSRRHSPVAASALEVPHRHR
jgi:hypothetical protein